MNQCPSCNITLSMYHRAVMVNSVDIDGGSVEVWQCETCLAKWKQTKIFKIEILGVGKNG